MSEAKKLDEQISTYLARLNDDQKKAVLTVVKTFAKEEEYDHWNDPSFVKEMETRYNDLKTGKDRGISLDQLEESARKHYKNKKRK
jgi:hypothetical protein